jgi:hypothetical protein
MAAKKSSSKPTEKVVEELVEEVVETPVVEEKKVVAPAKKAAPKKGGLPDPLDESLDAVAFVKAAYLSILKREADAGGLSNYSKCITMYQTMTRQEVLDDLLGSAEAAAL